MSKGLLEAQPTSGEGGAMGVRSWSTSDPDPHPAGTRDRWSQALGLRERDHSDCGFPAHWLYVGDQDVVHIGKAN